MRRLLIVYTALALTSMGCMGSQARPAASKQMISAPAAPEQTNWGSPAFGNFVRSREPQLQFCYEDARAASPTLAGSATVAVTLAPDGNVLDAGIVRRSWSGKGSDEVERCVLARVRGWKFPPGDPDDDRKVHSFAVIFTRS